MELLIKPESSSDLNIVWTPQEPGSWRDTLQLTDSRRIKYDVALVTTVAPVKKTAGKYRARVLAPSNTNRATRIREISPPHRREPKKTVATTSLGNLLTPSKRPRLSSSQPANKENSTRTQTPGWTSETYTKSGNPPKASKGHDFSAIINSTNFTFTPLKVDQVKLKPEDPPMLSIPFSPQSQGILSPESTEKPILRRETYTAAVHYKQITCEIDFEEVEDKEKFEDSLSPVPQSKSTLQKTFPVPKFSDVPTSTTNSNFITSALLETPRSDDFSPTWCSTGKLKNDNTISFREASPVNVAGNNTFDVSASKCSNESQSNGTYELLNSPSRSKILDPLKPTQLSKSFGAISPGLPYTPSEWIKKPSSSPISFALTTPKAEYSTRASVSFLHNYDDASVKEVLEADLWVKRDAQQTFTPSLRNTRSHSLERIDEENVESPFNLLRRGKTLSFITEKAPLKMRRFEISPPKKSHENSIRRVSPTKGTKIRKEKIGEPAAALKKKVQMNCSLKRGQVSIPGVRITNLSLAGLNKSHKEKSAKREVSVKLHDPEDFLTRFCNPDPFGATMTQDPFLTSTLYYDDKWMYLQELKFKKWLNALLTPPEHLNADVDTVRVDVGKVWQSCRVREDVALAETREAVSARYHTNTRLNTLRKAACAMFRREEVTAALSKSTVCVERGTLMIRQDRDLHRDIGLQKEILELFLSYNPLWLRIGLETVYGETIPLHSNDDLVGLTRFLITRFFSDPFIVKNHSHPTTTTVKLPTFVVHMNKFILKKFLLIVYFLDYAKRNKLIGHDPCLFHKRAAHKESRDILLTFSREVLGGVGDVTKVLRSHGYVVTHKQTHLDEYDYAVKDLATDLRDGVRLCRVMELITGDRNLTCRCRVPAISRLQKVHNADLALSALSRCGYTITGDIDAKSVADGHREKTLSLLWQIIYKYQAPRFDKAAKSVQKWWRANLPFVRTRHFLRTRIRNAATKIQNAWRTYRARKILEELREERRRSWARKEQAVKLIQLRWVERMKMVEERKKYLATLEAIASIQRWYRRKRETAPYVDNFRRKLRANLTIQAHWRAELLMRKVRRSYLDLIRACLTIQAIWRSRMIGKKLRREYENLRNSTILLQSKWRANQAMKIARDNFQDQRNAALIIQSWWRRMCQLQRDRNAFLLTRQSAIIIATWWIGQREVQIEKKKFQVARESAIVIQRNWRKFSQTKNDVANFKERREACKIVQQWWRSARIAMHYNRQRRSCVHLQRWWRGVVMTRTEVANFSRIRAAVIVFQKNWRMERQRRKYFETKLAVKDIESWYSNILVCRKIRQDFDRKKIETVKIQRWWRSLRVTWEIRSWYLNYKKTIIKTQTRWRANNIAKKTRSDYLQKRKAATMIQASWRMIRARRSFAILVNRHKAATIIQTRWRATLVARSVRNNYVQYRSAVIVFQTRYRALLIARRTRSEYFRKIKATTTLQKNWRMFAARKSYTDLRNATLTLQSRWRNRKLGNETCASFVNFRNATIKIQRRYRAKLIGRKIRENYINLRSVCLVVQRRLRANRSMRESRKKFVEYKNAAISVQAVWRMILEVRRYRLKRRAILTLQSRWRARVAAIECKESYLELRNSTIAVQRRFRGIKSGRKIREEYENTRKRVIWMQRAWRTKLENRVREAAATRLQHWWRSVLRMRECKKNYERQKAACVVLQRRYRAHRLCVEARIEYVGVLRAVCTVQRRWRCILKQKRYREWLEDCKVAVGVVENWWIRILEKKRRNAAATKVQAAWRGVRVRMKQCAVVKYLRERVENAAKSAVPTATVAYRMQESMEMFLVCDDIGQLLMWLSKLGL